MSVALHEKIIRVYTKESEMDLGLLMSKHCKKQGKNRYSTVTVHRLLQKYRSTLLPSQILSSRCRLTLCLSTSAILDDIFATF